MGLGCRDAYSILPAVGADYIKREILGNPGVLPHW